MSDSNVVTTAQAPLGKVQRVLRSALTVLRTDPARAAPLMFWSSYAFLCMIYVAVKLAKNAQDESNSLLEGMESFFAVYLGLALAFSPFVMVNSGTQGWPTKLAAIGLTSTAVALAWRYVAGAPADHTVRSAVDSILLGAAASSAVGVPIALALSAAP